MTNPSDLFDLNGRLACVPVASAGPDQRVTLVAAGDQIGGPDRQNVFGRSVVDANAAGPVPMGNSGRMTK